MPEAIPSRVVANQEVSLLRLGNLLLRSRRLIIVLGLAGGVSGLLMGLTMERQYESTATILPEGNNGGSSSLAVAASQFGIRIPDNGGGWSLPVYVVLLESRALLQPIALDTFVVAERDSQRIALMDLLEIQAPTPAERLDRTLQALGGIIETQERTTLGAVTLSVTTRWPSVSHALAQRLVQGVNNFNLRTRRSQATEERRFVEEQAAKAARALRQTEDRLQEFLQRNRVIEGSPELRFQYDRLQREVALHQQIYTSLLQSREEARIREVRDVPVVTVLEQPRVPIVPEPRRSVLKAIVGGLMGGTIAIIIAVGRQLASAAKRATDP
ncbi:MAG: Wzz/FepE/Etk N-terminal domain-containing protein, partial [Longimicrobiales bacterium]